MTTLKTIILVMIDREIRSRVKIIRSTFVHVCLQDCIIKPLGRARDGRGYIRDSPGTSVEWDDMGSRHEPCPTRETYTEISLVPANPTLVEEYLGSDCVTVPYSCTPQCLSTNRHVGSDRRGTTSRVVRSSRSLPTGSGGPCDVGSSHLLKRHLIVHNTSPRS